jgi:diguanylate cyclase (GGDEF)-like protein
VTIGTAVDSDVVVEDFGVSRHHARIERTGENAYSIEDLGSTNGTYLRNHRVEVASLHAGDLLQLGPQLRLRFATLDPVEATLYQGLYESSMQDPLTGAFNRRYLNERLVAEIAHARRTGRDVSVLMIDVDGLKEVNDRFGHLAGDRALSSIATRIQSVLRAEDMLARYGGDEFVVLALGTVGVAVLQLAERIRRAVEGLQMSARDQIVSLTASIGVASVAAVSSSSDPGMAVLATADARMYAAKASGRNRVCSVDPLPGNAQSGTWRDA